jgi:hypothetical protein
MVAIFSVDQHPADDMLYLQLPKNIIAENYSIFDLNG